MRYPFGRNGNGRTAARVAAHARCTVGDGKAAKATHFNALSLHQGIAQGFQQGLDSHLGVSLGQLTKTGSQLFYKV